MRTFVNLFLCCLIVGVTTTSAAAGPELVLQVGHVGDITQIVYSPDGKYIASGSKDGTVKVWDASSGALLSTLPDHHVAPLAVLFTADGKQILIAGADGTVTRWDALAATLLATNAGPVATPESAAIALRGGKVIVASAGSDHSIKLWNLPDKDGDAGTVLASLDGHVTQVCTEAFSPDGAYLASGSADGFVKFWDVDDESLIRTVQGHAMPVRSVTFTADDKSCADASDDGISEVWNVQSGKNTVELQQNAPGDGIGAVAFSPNGAMAITAGARVTDGKDYAEIWDVAGGTVKRSLPGPTAYVSAAAFSPDGASVATGGRDDIIRMWNPLQGGATHVLGGTDAMPCAVFARNSSNIVSAGADGAVRVWSALTGELLHVYLGHKGSVYAVAVSPDGKTILSGGDDNTVTISDYDTGALVKSLPAPGRVNTIAESPDGSLIAAGCGNDEYGGVVRIWKAGILAGDINAAGSLSAVRTVAFSADGADLAVASGVGGPGQVSLWDTHTRQQLFLDYAGRVRAVALTADGRRLVAACATLDDDDNPTGPQITVWNARTYAEQRKIPFAETGNGADWVAVAPDGRTAAVADNNGVIRLWDIKTGEALRTLTGHSGPALSVAFSDDGTAIVSSGADSTVRVWDAATGHLRATLIPFNAHQPGGGLDWLAVTPEGYYDGSPGASRFIRWQVGSASYPVEAFEDVLRRPEELSKSLAGQAVTPSPIGAQFDANAAAPPTVIFVTPHDGDEVSADAVDVTVQVASASPVNRIVLFANGRPVEDNGKPIELGAKPIELGAKPIELGAKPIELGAKPIELGAKALAPGVPDATGQQFSATVPFKPGDASVVISAVAYNADQTQGRQDVRVQRPSAATGAGKLYVLAVGISKYSNPHFNLKYAASDAAAFAGLWKPHAGTLYSDVVVTDLADDQATASNVRSALFKLMENATDQDTVVLFFSGHGLVLPDGSYYFATYEIDPATVDTVAATGLPWTSLQTALAQIKARRVLMFLDACHSGAALGDRQARGERMAEALASGAGVIVFSSSRGSEYSYELDDQQHGAFTAALIEGLGEGKANFTVGGAQGSTVTAEELLAYLRLRVPQLTDNRQTPSCPLLQDFGDPFPLVMAGGASP
jgi:WD40 repeat protein